MLLEGTGRMSSRIAGQRPGHCTALIGPAKVGPNSSTPTGLL
jgi:hypothetical protein